ncbi:MAG: thioredoxin family protein [Muribaculaceae bacterium]|nr:thioredoxin family protein [Muribaculaceae bacterium]
MTYNDVINSAKVVMVEFYATWCPHCQRMMPIVAQIAELLEGKVPVRQFDIDKNQQLADSENVESVPTFIIYVNGTEEWRHSGEIEAEALLSKVQSYL